MIKKRISQYIATITICILTMVSLMWISSWHGVYIEKSSLSFHGGEYTESKIPFTQDYLGEYGVKLEIGGVTRTAYDFTIYPDDELIALSVNGSPLSLDQFSKSQKTDYYNGLKIHITGLIPNGKNTLELRLINQSNPASFRIEASQNINPYQTGLILAILLIFAYTLKRHLPISKLQFVLLALSLCLSVAYLSHTNAQTRTFDVYEGGGHRDYINTIVNQHKLPEAGGGWEYHQPPAYYLIAAAAKTIATTFGNTSRDVWGQCVALFFWTIFLTSALACLRIGFKKATVPLALSSMALCFWPSGIIHSIRIGNDLALYAFYGLSFFYTLAWWKRRQSTTLYCAGFWMAVSIITKSNGLAIAATLGILLLAHIYTHTRRTTRLPAQRSSLLRESLMIGSMLAASVLINTGKKIYYYTNGTSSDWLLGNVSQTINSGLLVKNHLPNYLIFDIATFLQNPFINTWDDQYGRQYFWNFLFRSSLSSEFFFQGKIMSLCGISNGIFLLCAVSGMFIFFLQAQASIHKPQIISRIYRYLPWILGIIFPLILLLAYRIKAPFSCNTDFRYIYPVIICLLFVNSFVWKYKSKYPLPAFLSLGAPLIGINTFLWVYALTL